MEKHLTPQQIRELEERERKGKGYELMPQTEEELIDWEAAAWPDD